MKNFFYGVLGIFSTAFLLRAVYEIPQHYSKYSVGDCIVVVVILGCFIKMLLLSVREISNAIKSKRAAVESTENILSVPIEVVNQNSAIKKPKFCSNCGEIIEGNFCSSCGAAVSDNRRDSAIVVVNGVDVDLREVKRIIKETNQLHAMVKISKMTGTKDGKEVNNCMKKAMEYQDPAEIERVERLEREGIPSCPKCHSVHLSANQKGFSLGQAAAGWVIVGPMTGIVGGMLGRNRIKLTCLNCGYKFDIGQK